MRCRAEKTIPVCCREYGQPFFSKHISQMMEQLQSMNFEWSDEPYDVLFMRYLRHNSALKWWTNQWTKTDKPGWFDIGSHTWLKEFIMDNPPEFSISAKCCEYAKKRVGRVVGKTADVTVTGVRKAEGGVRMFASGAKCYYTRKNKPNLYRPLFWLSDADRAWYEKRFDIKHSDCYDVWGFKRTGCVGCPFNSRRENDLMLAESYEPNMVKAARSVFADSYEYWTMWNDYRDRRENGTGRLF